MCGLWVSTDPVINTNEIFFSELKSKSVHVFLIVCLYLNSCWRFNYQEGEDWVLINLFSHVTFLWPSSTKTWIHLSICHGLFVFNDLR